jgi:tol-pal system protein YbgF
MRPEWIAVALAGLGVAMGGGAGCARTAEERHLDDMREEIERIQVDRDRADQDALRQAAGGAEAVEGSPRVGSPGQTPSSDVRAIGNPPEASEDDPDTDDKTPRPSIRVSGSSRGGRYGGREDQVQQTMPEDTPGREVAQDPSGAPASRPSALDPQAKRAYDAAIGLVNARQYDKALDALAAFLVKWPDHPYADNAMYWRGECYFAKGDYARAAEQFEGTVNRFPAGNKVPDALLKLGMCQQRLGNPAKAKAWFDRLSAQFPQSEAAHRIPPVTVPATAPLGPASEDRR